MQNIINIFLKVADQYPDVIAIKHRNTSLTYSQLKNKVLKRANYLYSKGIANQDRVLVFIPMSIDLYVNLLAIFSVGATAVFVDEWVKIDRLNISCQIANCKGFVGSYKSHLLRVLSKEIRKITVKLVARDKSEVPIKEVTEVKLNDIALITFTTGSTGIPKAAKRTHGFLIEQFKVLDKELNPQPGEISMPVLPIVLLINLAKGATSVIPDYIRNLNKVNYNQIIDLIKSENIETITASPFFIERTAKELSRSNQSATSVKKIFTGGAPVFPDAAAKFSEVFNSADVNILYGSTEAEPISIINADDLKSIKEVENGLCVGRISDDVVVKIVKTDILAQNIKTETQLEEQMLKPLQIGEIIVAGPHVLKEYFNNPEAEKEVKIKTEYNVWHRTGDSGYISTDGKLYLTGRVKQIINFQNQFYYPFIEEYKLKSIEGVEMGTILNINNSLLVFVELKMNVNSNTFQKQILSLYSVPVKIKFIKIPRDPRHHSKIDYEKLLEVSLI